MVKHEDIWRGQCDATITIRARYGEEAALDYLAKFRNKPGTVER